MDTESPFPLDRAAHTSEAQELSHHPTPRRYVLIAVVLAVATAMEVLLYYLELPRTLLIVLLLSFAVVKFGLVVLYFMHLKFDSRLFRRMFFTGLILALIVYAVVLIIFGVFRP
jgi:cytochrome c oxidase subunit IV